MQDLLLQLSMQKAPEQTLVLEESHRGVHMDRATRAEMLHVRCEWRSCCWRWLLDCCCLLVGDAQHATGAGSHDLGDAEKDQGSCENFS